VYTVKRPGAGFIWNICTLPDVESVSCFWPEGRRKKSEEEKREGEGKERRRKIREGGEGSRKKGTRGGVKGRRRREGEEE
jgi:hypothetical protein